MVSASTGSSRIARERVREQVLLAASRADTQLTYSPINSLPPLLAPSPPLSFACHKLESACTRDTERSSARELEREISAGGRDDGRWAIERENGRKEGRKARRKKEQGQRLGVTTYQMTNNHSRHEEWAVGFRDEGVGGGEADTTYGIEIAQLVSFESLLHKTHEAPAP